MFINTNIEVNRIILSNLLLYMGHVIDTYKWMAMVCTVPIEKPRMLYS